MNEVNNNIKWEEAPEGTTHHYRDGIREWWLKELQDDKYRYQLIGYHKDWVGGYERLSHLRGGVLSVKPKLIEKQVMKLTAKDIRHTEAYKQLKHIAATATMVQRNGTHPQDALMLLVKMFLKNVNDYRAEHKIEGKFEKRYDIVHAFTWIDSVEGDEYWCKIHNGIVPMNLFPYRNKKAKPLAANPVPAPIVEVKKAPEPVKVAPKAVGWWG